MSKSRGVCFLIMFSFVGLVTFSGNASARFEKHVCSKPKFSYFKPGKDAEVAPGSAFSFRAPKGIAVHTVEVTVKGINVDMTVDDRKEFYYLNGVLPAELSDTFARVFVKGEVRRGCKGEQGWLIKITDGAEVAAE